MRRISSDAGGGEDSGIAGGEGGQAVYATHGGGGRRAEVDRCAGVGSAADDGGGSVKAPQVPAEYVDRENRHWARLRPTVSEPE